MRLPWCHECDGQTDGGTQNNCRWSLLHSLMGLARAIIFTPSSLCCNPSQHLLRPDGWASCQGLSQTSNIFVLCWRWAGYSDDQVFHTFGLCSLPASCRCVRWRGQNCKILEANNRYILCLLTCQNQYIVKAEARYNEIFDRSSNLTLNLIRTSGE